MDKDGLCDCGGTVGRPHYYNYLVCNNCGGEIGRPKCDCGEYFPRYGRDIGICKNHPESEEGHFIKWLGNIIVGFKEN
jgi:hypothetical protein